MLIVIDSSCSRLLRFCSSSHQRSGPTRRLTVSPSDMTSQRGEWNKDIDNELAYAKPSTFHSPQSADQVYDWITRHLPDGPKPPIYRPLNYFRIVAVTTSVLGLVSFLSVVSPYIFPIIQNRNLWAAISLIIILLFTSGHMFNHIRKVPYVSGDGKGGISYFAGGFSNQFGLETQIVAAMCKCSFNFLILTWRETGTLTAAQTGLFPLQLLLLHWKYHACQIRRSSRWLFSHGVV